MNKKREGEMGWKDNEVSWSSKIEVRVIFLKQQQDHF